jgi:hypothetical protein
MAGVVGYEVFKQGVRVLSFQPRAGVLLSTALRPPKVKPTSHPFLNAQAHDALVESRLGELLRRATSVSEFITLLEADGFEVRKLGKDAA